MSDVFYTPPAADLKVETQDNPTFFVVAPVKLIVMMLLTYGLYTIYWIYKSWAVYKLHSRRPIWPVARTFFSVFYIPSMFCKIDRSCKSVTGSGMPYWRWCAALYLVLPLASVLMSFANGMYKALYGYEILSMGFWFGFWTGILSLVIQSLVLLRAQRFINLAQGDPAGLSNNGFSIANVIWMGIGIASWIAFPYWTYINSVG